MRACSLVKLKPSKHASQQLSGPDRGSHPGVEALEGVGEEAREEGRDAAEDGVQLLRQQQRAQHLRGNARSKSRNRHGSGCYT